MKNILSLKKAHCIFCFLSKCHLYCRISFKAFFFYQYFKVNIRDFCNIMWILSILIVIWYFRRIWTERAIIRLSAPILNQWHPILILIQLKNKPDVPEFPFLNLPSLLFSLNTTFYLSSDKYFYNLFHLLRLHIWLIIKSDGYDVFP